MERTRDVKDVIRREAFLWLANKCSIRHLTIEERIQVGVDLRLVSRSKLYNYNICTFVSMKSCVSLKSSVMSLEEWC